MTALSTLAVSAASARRRSTSMLCNIQHIHDRWPREGGIMGGGVVTPILCVYLCVHCTSAIYMCTPVLHGHADR